MTNEQKQIIQRLATVLGVLVCVVLTAYFAYRPAAKKAVIGSNSIPIFQLQKTAVLGTFQSGEWNFGPPLGSVAFRFGREGDIPFTGFWRGGTAPSIGAASDGKFSLLIDGVQRDFEFGNPGDIPVSGDWTGTGRSDIGTYNKGFWMLDMNGNRHWDGPPIDRFVALGGMKGEIPIVGDWNGDGKTKVGVFAEGEFHLDFNGNGVWDKEDKIFYFGKKGDIPVVGDWNGDGRSKIGAFNNGFWVLDYNGNGQWDGPPRDRLVALGGVPTDVPVVGDWNGDGRGKVGILRLPNSFHLDYNGNGAWDENDQIMTVGASLARSAIVLNSFSAKK